jgi:hypothetical protein
MFILDIYKQIQIVVAQSIKIKKAFNVTIKLNVAQIIMVCQKIHSLSFLFYYLATILCNMGWLSDLLL